ncbi:MAG: hypothetical protein Q8Q60_04690 [Candidatus Chromulinivorax sp.]|nr:hypothetical protein [Candidatus Chromulinivorax sp.]
MIIYSIIKLQSVRKQNVYLLVLFGLLSCQQIEASKSGPPKPLKTGKSAISVESAKFGEHVTSGQRGSKRVDVKLLETTGRTNSSQKFENNGLREVARERSVESNAVNGKRLSRKNSGLFIGETAPNTASQPSAVSPKVASFAKRSATIIAENFSWAIQRLDQATKLPTLCNKMIAEPLTKAWKQARKLEQREVKKSESLNLTEGSVEASTGAVPVTQVERGLLNTKIDKIIDSVVNMYNNGLSPKEIGTFVKNSVELALVTPVVGMGAGAGAFVGGVSVGAGGAVAGAGIGLGAAGKLSPLIFFTPAVIVPIGGGGFVGGAYGTGVGAFEGASAGARHTSNFLQKPITTVKNMGVEAWNAPEYLGNKYFSSKSTVKDGNKQPNPKKQTNNKSFQQTSSAGNNSSQGNQSAA